MSASVTRAEAMKALEESGAWQNPKTQLWTWHRHDDPKDIMWHSEEDALTITRACLYLAAPVTDVVSGAVWLRLIERVISLELRVNGGTA